jgi:hypothetical protein
MSELLIPNYLRAAAVNQRIYPPGSPMVEKAVSQITQALEPTLKAADKLTYTSRQGKIFFKGSEIPDAAALAPMLDEHGIQSVTFLPGVTSPEVAQFIILISRKKLAEGTVGDWLKAQKVTHIQVDKVTVVEIMEGEVVQKRVDQLFEHVGDFPGLLASMRESFDMMDKVPDERQKAKVQEHMAHKMAGMSPALLRDMFENELPPKMEASGIKGQVLNAMTQEKIHDIFSEIGSWYKQVRESTSNELEVVEHLNKFKSFLGKLLNAPASKKVPFGLYEELLNQGLIDKVPEGLERKPEEESLAFQVESLLEKPAGALLEKPVRDQLPFMLKKLCDIGLDDLSQKLLEKLIENYAQGAAVVRQMAVRASRQFIEILWANRKDRLWNVLCGAIEKLAEQERSPDVYKELADTYSMSIVHFALNDRFDDAARMLGLLRRHKHEENAMAPRRQDYAGTALEQVADNLMEVLAEAVLSPDKERKEAGQTLLAHLGDGAVPCYVRMIKKAPDLRHRRLAAGALKYYAAAGKAKLAAEFHLGNSTEVLLNVLSVLDDFLSPDLVPRFEAFLHFPDVTIRRRLIQLLGKVPGPQAGPLLIKFLDDPDEVAQIDAVRALGEMRSQAASAKLVDMLKTGSTRRLEETCLALGQIADPQALPALAEILEPKSSLFKKRAAVEETVRVRAAWALAQFKSAEAREALARLAKDANLQVQTIAKNALLS